MKKNAYSVSAKMKTAGLTLERDVTARQARQVATPALHPVHHVLFNAKSFLITKRCSNWL